VKAAVVPGSMADPGPPGWHGKLPSLGDFASRRLGPEFVAPWDGWLAAGLHALRGSAPEHWLQHYLTSPSWRFLLQPGVLPGGGSGTAPGAQAWAGVLVPSVDRVGRYFPLTLVQPLGSAAPDHRQLQALWRGLTAWDDLARDALHDDWSAEQLEAELHRHHAAHGSVGAASASAAPLEPGAAAAGELPREVGQAVPDEGPARLWLVRGLPASLGLLFDGAHAP
jgi:type VI secretion system protein ImpM